MYTFSSIMIVLIIINDTNMWQYPYQYISYLIIKLVVVSTRDWTVVDKKNGNKQL